MTKKLEKLTREQEALIPIVRDEWIKFCLGGDSSINREMAITGLRWIYGLARLDEPRVVFVGGPFACQIAVWYIEELFKHKKLPDSVRDSVRDSVLDSVRASVADSVGASVRESVVASVRDSVLDSVRASVADSVRESVRESVRDSVLDSVADSVRESVLDSVADSVRDSVRESVRESVRDSVLASVADSVADSVRESVLDSVLASVADSVRDSVADSVADSVRAAKKEFNFYGWCDLGGAAGWIPLADYFYRIGIKVHDNFAPYRAYVKSGVFMTILLRGFAIVCPRPTVVKKDEQGRLHNSDGPATEWEGEKYWFWHGVRVSERIIMKTNELTAKEISDEKNSEVSRAIAEKLGWDRYMETLGTVLIDKWFDPSQSLHYELYDFKERKFSLMPRLLKMESPELNDGTRPYYIEPVDPKLDSCQSARKWQFKKHDGTWPTVKECNSNPELVFERES